MPDIFDAKNSEPLFTVDAKNSLKKTFTNKSHDELKTLKTPANSDRHSLPHHTHNPFSSMYYYPDHAKFVNQDSEEKVILIIRKHPITNLKWILTAFVMFMAPSFFTLVNPYDSLPGGFQIVISLVWYLITSAFILERFLSWFFNVNIVTDERIIEIDFVNLLYREITVASADQIQDVTVVVSGGARTFFRYGDVIIQTAAEIPKITFEAIPNPDFAERVLRDLQIEEEQEKIEGRVR